MLLHDDYNYISRYMKRSDYITRCMLRSDYITRYMIRSDNIKCVRSSLTFIGRVTVMVSIKVAPVIFVPFEGELKKMQTIMIILKLVIFHS